MPKKADNFINTTDKDLFKWKSSYIQEYNLANTEFVLYSWLWRWTGGGQSFCQRTDAEIMKKVDSSARQIIRALKSLESKGLIIIWYKRSRGETHPRRIALFDPAEPFEWVEGIPLEAYANHSEEEQERIKSFIKYGKEKALLYEKWGL